MPVQYGVIMSGAHGTTMQFSFQAIFIHFFFGNLFISPSQNDDAIRICRLDLVSKL